MIIPSVIATSQQELDTRLTKVSGAKCVHLDVMDGSFVSHHSLDFAVQLPRVARYEAHLMVDDPLHWISKMPPVIDTILVHPEARRFSTAVLDDIHARGFTAGIAVNPDTPLSAVEKYLGKVEKVLVMSVSPGRYGAAFIPAVLRKISALRTKYPTLDIGIDGGIDPTTIGSAASAGASSFVVGSYLQHTEDVSAATQELIERIVMARLDHNGAVRKLARKLRIDCINMISAAGSGHPGGSLGMADIVATLYYNHLRLDPRHPRDPRRDYLVLSNGHICPVLYAAMATAGFIDRKKLLMLRKLGSPLQGHPHRESLAGLETSSGPLGSGLSQACGMALGLRMQRRFIRVFCLMSDGEHDEGNTWEALLFAAKYKLDNLVAVVDRNNIQIDGPTSEILPLHALEQKYRSFGWHVVTIKGNDVDDIIAAFARVDVVKGMPTAIIAHTIPGKGVSFMENDYRWHGKAPTAAETKRALRELMRDEHG